MAGLSWLKRPTTYGTVATSDSFPSPQTASASTPTAPAEIYEDSDSDDEDYKQHNIVYRVYRSYRGAFLILLAEFLMSVMNAVARYLETSLPQGRKFHPFHVMFWRMIVTCSCCLAYGFYSKVPDFPFGKRNLWPILILRACSGFVGISCFYAALKTLPLPDATVINFCVPAGEL